MPQSLPDTTPPKRRFRWPTGMPQLAALLLVLLTCGMETGFFRFANKERTTRCGCIPQHCSA